MSITGRADIIRNMAKGYGFLSSYQSVGPGATTTTASTGSNNYTLQLFFNFTGTTLPGTLVGFPLPPALTSNLFLVMSHANNTTGRCGLCLVYLYKIGTVDLTGTGDKFTHDAATFPLLRTQFGVTSQPITLIPIVNITTATTVSAATFILKTVAGGAGYVNQDGSSIVGTTTFTFPSATTAINSAFLPRLESGDSGIRDIAAVDVTGLSVLGAADIWGMEILAPISQMGDQPVGLQDAVFGGLSMVDLAPAVATSGTVTSKLALAQMSVGSANITVISTLMGVLNV